MYVNSVLRVLIWSKIWIRNLLILVIGNFFLTLFTIYSQNHTFWEMWIIIKEAELKKKSLEALFGVFYFGQKLTITNVYFISVVLFLLLTILGNLYQCSKCKAQKSWNNLSQNVLTIGSVLVQFWVATSKTKCYI